MGTVGGPPHLIEVLTKVDGIDFDQAVEGARSFGLDGRSIPFIARTPLLKNKRAV